MRAADHTPDDPEGEEWDAIVVGTGMGGGTFGYELARRGRRVLYLDRGKFLHGGPHDKVEPRADADPEEEMRLLTGRWPKQLTGKTSFGPGSILRPRWEADQRGPPDCTAPNWNASRKRTSSLANISLRRRTPTCPSNGPSSMQR